MFDEMFMEDCIEEAPRAFLGCDLQVAERQAKLGGFRPDIVGSYQDVTWIVEIQQRALDRVHLYKCLEYRDLLKQRDKIDRVKLVIVCNTIDQRYLPTAETHGVEIISIDREKFVELASQHCPRSVAKFFKRRGDSEFVERPRSMVAYSLRPLGWSGSDSVLDILEHIHSECGRTALDLDKLKEGRYWSILYELKSLFQRDWRHSIASIVSPEDWNIDQLIREPKDWQPDLLQGITRIRKPAIEIAAFVTIRDNLSIVWWPKGSRQSRYGRYKIGDWARWPGEDTYGWSRPSNELLFIRDIHRLCPGEIRQRFESSLCNWDVLDELFIALVKASYDWLCEVLSTVVSVEKITDFDLKLVDPSPTDFDEDLMSQLRAPKRIVGWSIYNIEARKQEQESLWIQNFESEYKVSLKHLVDTYNACLTKGRNRVPASRAKYVASDLGKEGIALSRSQIDRIVTRLKAHHSHYVDLASE